MRVFSRRTLPAFIYYFACFSCIVWITPTFIVHESHFYLSAAIRTNYDLNVKVGEWVQGFMRYVDEYGTDQSPLRLDAARFRSLAGENDFAALANLSVDSLLRLYPPERHNAYFFGIADSWSQWVCMMMICGVRNCDRALPFDLSGFNLRTTNAWRGLAGSDDVLWATLMTVERSDLVDVPYRWNGARGAKQLFGEVEKHFLEQSGNATDIFWDTNRLYTATIGVSLWVAACAKLSRVTGDKKFLNYAVGAVGTLLHGDKPLISQTGHVFDG
jgi:hypothetical protein